MPKGAKISTDFGASTEPVFSDEVVRTVNYLTLNSGSFTGLPVAPSAVTTLLGTFNTTRNAVYYLGQVADTATARTAVQKAITKNGNWINDFALGNVALLQKSGYPLQKDDVAQGKLDATVLTLTPLVESVEFFISIIKGQGIRYAVYYTLFDTAGSDYPNWTTYYAAQREGVVSHLISGKKYKMVSVAMGTDNDITYSTEVTFTPQ